MTIEIQLTIPEEGIVSKVADGAAKGRLVGLRLGEGTGRAVSEFVSGLFRASPASGSCQGAGLSLLASRVPVGGIGRVGGTLPPHPTASIRSMCATCVASQMPA